MPENPETVLEIDLNALAHNYSVLRSRIRPGTRLLGVVKAFAYGSEAIGIARKLEALGADYLAVAYASEGVFLRKAGIRLPILVLHPQPNGMEEIIETCLEPSLYSPRILREFIKTAQAMEQKAYPVHLKFNTGLNRLGFWENDLEWIDAQLQGTDALEIRSLFSHLAASDDRNEREFTLGQLKAFEGVVKNWEQQFKSRPFYHLLNTSGVFNYPEAQYDMVRTGIGLYGYSNDPETDSLLKPVSSLRTRISQIHKIEPGEWVGYNKGYTAPDFRVTATLPIGHADGIGRQYGQGKGRVYIQGKPAPIIGNVCMDMTMVDISDISCKEGDEVVFFGDGISAEGLASRANTISYELLTGISQRVPRIITGA
ncbi:MAG: alanine racemase [Robiginitalea sp.]|uniref:alanine racemase n=2 Tax=Robiginitalea sp. TaxID=1902411 RepID=UPI003C767B54